MQTLSALMREAYARPQEAALSERVNGAWSSTSSARVLERAENIALALRDLGLQTGERAAIIALNCVDWILADAGILFAACVVVPIFPTQAAEHVQFILSDSDAKMVFVDSVETAGRIRSIAPALPLVIFGTDGADSLAAFEARGAGLRAAQPQLIGSYEKDVRESDLAVLIYTSGTTGQPKGVMLSHSNLTSNARDLFDSAFRNIERGEHVLSVLPFSHIYECTFIYIYMLAGVSVYISHVPEELLPDLRDVRPATMTSVPRIFERVLAGIVAKAQQGNATRGKLVNWSLAIGRDYARAKAFAPGPNLLLRLHYFIAHALVLKKIPPILGLDNVRYVSSGSAALHLDTALTFSGLGIAILQGYGLTETSPVVSANTMEHNKFGSVGRPIPHVAVRIAADGEVEVKGPNVMQGYFHDAAATALVIADGWFKTGDIGHLDADGFLFITDRKKELLKTSGGKYLSPARIESAIKRSVYISQVVLIGDDRPHPLALIAPNWDMVRQTLGIDATQGGADLALRADVIAFVRKEVGEHTADLAPYEQVRRIVVLPRDLTIEAGELSPTMKVKRRVIETKYAFEIELGYAETINRAAARPQG